MKHNFFEKTRAFVGIALAAIVASSCEPGFTDFPSFFKNYTEEAAIELYDLGKDYPKDKYGNICISSDDDKIISLYLRNPQHYTNELGLNYELLNMDAHSSAKPGDVTLIQDEQDDGVLLYTFSSDYLKKMEMGGVLDTHFELYQQISGSRVRDFPEYDLKLHCNSEPPAVRNLTVLQYAYSDVQERYVLAFNMPDMSTIHKDIVSLKINGTEYKVDPGILADSDTVGLDLSTNSPFTVNTSQLKDLKPTGSKEEFYGEFESRAVYFKTEQPLSDKEIKFEILISDKAGLNASSTVTAYAERLAPTTASYDGELSLTTDDDGYLPVTFYAPGDNKDATVYYAVYDLSKTNIIKQGYGKGSVSTRIAAGAWVVESWAHKSGFVDSYPKQDTTYIGGALYVNANYDGSNGTSDGGMSTPYKTIGDALEAAKNALFPSVTLILQSDISLENSLDVNTDFVSITLNGQNTYKIDIQSPVAGAECIVVGDGTNSPELRLNNIQVGNVKVYSGSSIVVIGSTHSIENKMISLEDDDAKLFVQSKTGSKYLNLKYIATPENGWLTVRPLSNIKLSDETLDLFILKNDGYYLGNINGAGVIQIPGVTLSVPSRSNMFVDLKANSAAPSKNAQGLYEIKARQKLSAEIFIKKGDGKNKYITVNNMKMYFSQDDVVIAENTGSTYTVPSLIQGKYALNISYEYDGLKYSTQLYLQVME